MKPPGATLYRGLGPWLRCTLRAALLAAPLLSGLLLAPSSALALDGNDALVLALEGGAVVQGWYVGIDDGVLRLSGDNRFTDVPLDQVVGVQRDGQPLDLSVFHAEAASAQAELEALRADPPRVAPPAVAFGASLVWAGAGHAAVGDWRAGAGWAAVDLVLLGAAAYTLGVQRSSGAAIPIVAIDLLVRAAAAGDAARLSRRERRRLDGLQRTPGP